MTNLKSTADIIGEGKLFKSKRAMLKLEIDEFFFELFLHQMAKSVRPDTTRLLIAYPVRNLSFD